MNRRQKAVFTKLSRRMRAPRQRLLDDGSLLIFLIEPDWTKGDLPDLFLRIVHVDLRGDIVAEEIHEYRADSHRRNSNPFDEWIAESIRGYLATL